MQDPESFFPALPRVQRERCWDAIGEHGEDCESPTVIILNISRQSLKNLDFEDAEIQDFCDFEDWSSLEGVLGPEEIEMHQTDFQDAFSFLVLLYSDKEYVTSAQG